MSPRLLSQLTLGAAVGSGLMAGVFFAFSTFVMPALARLPGTQGAEAMQAINVAAVNRWLMGALFGTALAAAVLGLASGLGAPAPGGRLRLLGAGCYLGGVVLVTAAFNVPRNDALAALGPADPALAGYWLRYLSEWTAWNHLRTVAALVAAVVLTQALAAGSES